MHSRVGLSTEYLSDRWFELIAACVDEAAHAKLEAWLYDEDRWPSGPAGGLLTKDPRWQMKRLRLIVSDQYNASEFEPCESHAFLVALTDEQRLNHYRKIDDPLENPPAKGEKYLIFIVEAMEPMSWFNGGTYLDTLSQEAVAQFIKITHEKYKEAVGHHFGKTIPGIFTDEPMHGSVLRNIWNFGVSLPWTQRLPGVFEKMFGYDIMDHLPELVYDRADRSYSQPRYHYHRCKTRMFVDAFSKQIADWCLRNQLLMTGHVLEEEPISANASVVGSCMQFYEYMQAPGIDNLTQFRDHYVTVKQCVSVARQMGRKWILSELYGCTGWETTFETYKYIGDWQAALGITLRCPHLSHYTLAGEAKRDYPASIHFHSPWWKEYSAIEDYFARLNVLLTCGEPVCDLAVIHPVESVTFFLNNETFSDVAIAGTETAQKAEAIDRSTDELSHYLIGRHMDFDFIDEQILENIQGDIEKCKKGTRLRVGKMRYAAVIVPKMATIRMHTLNVLRMFAQAGGAVFFIEGLPPAIEGRQADVKAILGEARIVALHDNSCFDALKNNVTWLDIKNEQGDQDTEIIYQLRRDEMGYTLFLVNTNRVLSKMNVSIKFQADKDIQQVQLWDAFTGDRCELLTDISGTKVHLNIDIPSTGSVLLKLVFRTETCLPCLPRHKKVTSHQLEIDPSATILSDLNVFVLDKPDVVAKTDDGRIIEAKAMEIVQLDEWLRSALKLSQRSNMMTQPWANQNEPLGRTAQTAMTYTLQLDSELDEDVWLAIEQPERWTVAINHKKIDLVDSDQWWVDPAIRKIKVNRFNFQKGHNTILLEGQFDRLANIEILYILGSFGVKQSDGQFVVTSMPHRIGLGAWTTAGLPFYAGDVTYISHLEYVPEDNCRRCISFPKYVATAVEVAVNDTKMPLVFYGNHCIDVTEALKPGTNRLQIRLLGSLRNAFGPLHLAMDVPDFVGPESYRKSHSNWQDGYKLLNYGIFDPPVVHHVQCLQSAL